MDPIRLALDVGPLHGHRTGVGVAVAEVEAALRARHDIEVQPYLLSFRTIPEPPTRRLPLPAAVAHRSWARRDWPRVDRWLRDVDVVHGTNYVVPPSRHPRVVSVYDGWFLAQPELASPTVRRAGEVLRRSVADGAVIHASSQATADLVGGLLGTDRVVVIHLGPLPALAAPTSVPPALDRLAGAPFLLALGTTERRKNLPALVDAFGRSGDALAGVHLVLAGAPGDDDAALDAAVAVLPGPRRSAVVRTGAVPAATKAWLVHHATALAYPSLDEGFGFPILEAQEAGLPVVATRAGSIPEVGGAGVALVDVGDVDALAVGLVQVVTDERHRSTLIAAGYTNVERFSWTTTAESLVQLYRRLQEGSI